MASRRRPSSRGSMPPDVAASTSWASASASAATVDDGPVADFVEAIDRLPPDEWRARTLALERLLDAVPDPSERTTAASATNAITPWYESATTMRRLSNPLRDLLLDLRSTVVKNVTQHMTTLFAVKLQPPPLPPSSQSQQPQPFVGRHLFKDLLPHILNLHAQTVRVIKSYAYTMMLTVLPVCKVKSSLPILLDRLRKDKSRDVREACARYFRCVLTTWPEQQQRRSSVVHDGDDAPTSATDTITTADAPYGYLSRDVVRHIGNGLARALMDPSQCVRMEARAGFDVFRTVYRDVWDEIVHKDAPDGILSKDVRLRRNLINAAVRTDAERALQQISSGGAAAGSLENDSPAAAAAEAAAAGSGVVPAIGTVRSRDSADIDDHMDDRSISSHGSWTSSIASYGGMSFRSAATGMSGRHSSRYGYGGAGGGGHGASQQQQRAVPGVIGAPRFPGRGGGGGGRDGSSVMSGSVVASSRREGSKIPPVTSPPAGRLRRRRRSSSLPRAVGGGGGASVDGGDRGGGGGGRATASRRSSRIPHVVSPTRLSGGGGSGGPPHHHPPRFNRRTASAEEEVDNGGGLPSPPSKARLGVGGIGGRGPTTTSASSPFPFLSPEQQQQGSAIANGSSSTILHRPPPPPPAKKGQREPATAAASADEDAEEEARHRAAAAIQAAARGVSARKSILPEEGEEGHGRGDVGTEVETTPARGKGARLGTTAEQMAHRRRTLGGDKGGAGVRASHVSPLPMSPGEAMVSTSIASTPSPEKDASSSPRRSRVAEDDNDGAADPSATDGQPSMTTKPLLSQNGVDDAQSAKPKIGRPSSFMLQRRLQRASSMGVVGGSSTNINGDGGNVGVKDDGAPLASAPRVVPEHVKIARELVSAHRDHIDELMTTLRREMDVLTDFEQVLAPSSSSGADGPTEEQVLEYFESVALCLDERTVNGDRLRNAMDLISRGDDEEEKINGGGVVAEF